MLQTQVTYPLHLPNILFLARDSLRGLKWITPNHSAAIALYKSLDRWSRKEGYAGDDLPPEYDVHMYALVVMGNKKG